MHMNTSSVVVGVKAVRNKFAPYLQRAFIEKKLVLCQNVAYAHAEKIEL